MKPAKTIRWIERCLWVIGLVLLTWVGYVWADGRAYQAHAEAELEQARADAVTVESPAVVELAAGAEPMPKMPEELPGDVGEDDEKAPPAPKPDRAGSETVGKLEIPRLGLSVMVSEGTTARVLRRGAGHLTSTPLPGPSGNAAIAGHRDRHFRPLEHIDPGDELIFTGLDGTYRYEVEWTEIVRPEETRVLAPTDEPSLTLITCYPFYFVGHAPKRFIVRAKLIGAESLDPAPGG